MWDFKGCGVQRLQGKTLGPKIRTSEDPTALLNHSCHIIIIEVETCISPTPINYVTYWALSHPIIITFLE